MRQQTHLETSWQWFSLLDTTACTAITAAGSLAKVMATPGWVSPLPHQLLSFLRDYEPARTPLKHLSLVKATTTQLHHLHNNWKHTTGIFCTLSRSPHNNLFSGDYETAPMPSEWDSLSSWLWSPPCAAATGIANDIPGEVITWLWEWVHIFYLPIAVGFEETTWFC